MRASLSRAIFGLVLQARWCCTSMHGYSTPIVDLKSAQKDFLLVKPSILLNDYAARVRSPTPLLLLKRSNKSPALRRRRARNFCVRSFLNSKGFIITSEILAPYAQVLV